MPILHYFEYDLAGQRTAMADPGGRTAFTYDNLGQMTFRGNPGSLNLYYQYDATGNRTTFKDPDGFLAYYFYDPANRLKEVSSQGYGLQPYGRSPYGGYVSYYEYDLANELVHERRANTTISYYAYDAAGRTSLIQHRTSAAATIQRYDYTRDEAGNITKQVRGTDSMVTYWNYDPANRITREQWWTSGLAANIYGFDYAYDPAGNRTSKRNSVASSTVYWEYDSADQMTRQKAGTAGTPVTVYFTYDSNGNLGVEHDVDASAGLTYYDYEARNLLTKVDFPGATATNYFEYNANGERTRKDDSTGGKKYTWDGIDVIAEKNLSGTTTQRLVKGYTPIQGIGAYALQDVNGSIIYPHKNQVGTTIRHTDGSQGITNYYEYDGWGVPIETTQGTAQQYRFTGKELDPDSIVFNSQNSRYHFPVRFALPFRGMFGQVDPLRSKGGLSVVSYSYPLNPVRYMDPWGLMACCNEGQDEPPDPLNRGKGQYPLPFLKEPPICDEKICGPDISAALRAAILAVKKQFITLGSHELGKRCQALIDPASAAGAWDITDLHAVSNTKIYPWLSEYKPCGESAECIHTVTVNKKCYHAGAVNYVLFGLVMKMCGYSKDVMTSAISWHKGASYAPVLKGVPMGLTPIVLKPAAENYEQSQAWADAGYEGWPSGNLQVSDQTGKWKQCKPCEKQYMEQLQPYWGAGSR